MLHLPNDWHNNLNTKLIKPTQNQDAFAGF